MDPDTNLAEIRKLLSEHYREGTTDYGRLADLVDSLDNWMAKGGFMPSSWEKNR